MGKVNLDTWTFHVSEKCATRGGEATVASVPASQAESTTKAEPCGVCCAGRWSAAVESVDGIMQESLDNLTKREIRLRIASRVGLNTNAKTPFTKRELNSIYAYLTGSHYFPKRDYRTPSSPTIKVLREVVAEEAGVEAFRPSQFMHNELVALCRAIESTEDKR